MDEFIAKGASVRFIKEGLRFDSGHADTQANLMLSVMGTFAEFERSLIRERQAEGIRLAKAPGRHRDRSRKMTDQQVGLTDERRDLGGPRALWRAISEWTGRRSIAS